MKRADTLGTTSGTPHAPPLEGRGKFLKSKSMSRDLSGSSTDALGERVNFHGGKRASRRRASSKTSNIPPFPRFALSNKSYQLKWTEGPEAYAEK